MQASVDEETPVSIMTPIGYQLSSCGYCKQNSSGLSYYAKAKSLAVEHYQDLIDRGWRRSGTLLYKPDVKRSCCPHYTIRLPVASFKPSKDQRQAVNRWNRHVLGETYISVSAREHPKSRSEKARRRGFFDLVDVVHESEYNTLTRPPEPAHRFTVSLEKDDFSDEKYDLFEHYQQHVHGEASSQISRNGFSRFLCSSPLQRKHRVSPDGVRQDFGSFHQCYRLDGRLIAIAVLDLLPRCISSVYFIYNREFERWSFGKLSALREVALAVEYDYPFYCMGYYIHSCIKMRYKGDYKQQYVLDPESYNWNPLDDSFREKLDVKPYISLSREARISETRQEMADDADCSAEAMDWSAEEHDDPRAAAAAINNGLSLFKLGFPGMMSGEELSSQVDLGNIWLKGGGGFKVKLQDLASWEDSSILDPQSLKGVVAEFAACVGPSVASNTVLDFRG